jgi:glycosyltransferase involved in cell wall biosynthesis
MVGGRREQVDAMRTRVRELGIEKSVSFSGTVPSNEISSYLGVAHVIASPRSSGTNTPLKLYGYLRSGVPLVATDKYTHTQTLNPTISHLVPATPNDFAEGILTLLTDRNYAMQLAAAAVKQADESYSDRAYLDRVAKFYSRVFDRIDGYRDSVGAYSESTSA